MLGERKELVQGHLIYVVNMRDQSNNSQSMAVDNFHSELEKQSMSLWKQEFRLTDERRMIDTRKDTAQKQLDELNKFRLDLMMKKWCDVTHSLSIKLNFDFCTTLNANLINKDVYINDCLFINLLLLFTI